MWIAIGIIVGVYLVLYAFESLWSFAVISPANLHAKQAETISDLTEQNSKLHEAAYPKISLEEERRRNIVAGRMKGLTEQSKKVLRYIMDHGSVQYMTLAMEFNLPTSPPVVQDWLASDLLVSIGGMVSVKEEFRSSVDHLLSSDGI